MAILEVLRFPDARLRIVAEPVIDFTSGIEQLVADMLETMYEEKGIGLAATQVGVHLQVLVLDVSETRDQPRCFINPALLGSEGLKEYDEGCLSVPGESAIVSRPDTIKVLAYDQFGKSFEGSYDGLMSVCLQHEMDHLKGKLFLDYLSPLKRARLEKRLIKANKQSSIL